MARPDLWYHCIGDPELVPLGLISDALSRVNLSMHALHTAEPSGPGLLFADFVGPEVVHWLRGVKDVGADRILVVMPPRTAVQTPALWRLMEGGAADVLQWDRADDPCATIASRLQRWSTIDDLVHSSHVARHVVGESRAWIAALREIVELAYFTNASVLILGESGTGKELVARAIHDLDGRPHKRGFVVLDCSTVVPELSGSEFFGHERGAYTNAVSARDGAFALANGGTLFLDEVGELPLPLQGELLRVVQEHTYKRLGSNTWQHTDFRLLCATNKDLSKEVDNGTFRRDFYYRISGSTCRLPSLHERREDILLLARHFLERIYPDDGPPEFDPEVRDYLLTRNYPGNVRDLQQLITRIAYRHVGGGRISIGDIPENERPFVGFVQDDWRDDGFKCAIRRAVAMGVGLRAICSCAADTAVTIAMESEGGNLQRAAHSLGVTDRALQMRRAARRNNAGYSGSSP